MHASDMDLDGVVALETRVWDALRRGDAEEDARLLADDFLGVYPSGFANRSDHVGQLASGPTVADFELHDPRMMVISEDDVLLSYRAEWHRVASGDDGPAASMFISSLWSRRAGRWVNVFSQDSPARPA